MSEKASGEAYSRAQICRLLGLSPRQLQQWIRAGLVADRPSYTITDILVLRTLQQLRRRRISTAAVRQAIVNLRRWFELREFSLKDIKLTVQGKKIVARVHGCDIEPFSGQLLLDFDSDRWSKVITFPIQRTVGKSETSGTVQPPHRNQRALEQARHFFEKAYQLEQLGAPAHEVIALYQRSLEYVPDLAPAHLNLGTLYFHAGDFEKARYHYVRAAELEPESPLVHFNLGNLYDELGQKEEAIRHYLTAIQLDPRYQDAHYNLALLYQQQGQFIKALHHWKIYMKLDPHSSWSAIARRQVKKLESLLVKEKKHQGQPEST